MRALIVIVILVVSHSFASPAMATMSRDDCLAVWKNADVNGDGKMDGLEAKPFIDAMISAQEKSTGSTGKSLPPAEFLKSCEAGTFDGLKIYHNT